MNEWMKKELEKIARKKFYETYGIKNQNEDRKFVIMDGMVNEIKVSSKKRPKQYCATSYMKIE